MQFLELAFGKLPSEIALEKSQDKRFHRMLRAIYIFRFLVFPLSASILFAFLLLGAVRMVLGVFCGLLDLLYTYLTDSAWLKLRWFNITLPEYKDELAKVTGKTDVDSNQ